MNTILHNTFNEEVGRFKKSLLFYAKQRNWDTFMSKAGSMFDYIESVEIKEIERKFFKIFKIILSILIFAVFFIISLNPESNPNMVRIREMTVIAALAGCCYELYLFISLRVYLKHKKNFYLKRRERFIHNLKGDFRDIIVPSVVEQRSDSPEHSLEPEQVLQNAF